MIRIEKGEAAEWLGAQPAKSVDLVFGSPPYPGKTGRYGPEVPTMTNREWVAWMSRVSLRACRISRGDVLWVVNGPVVDGQYIPVIERLQCELEDVGLILERPCIWHKNSPPNRRNWFVNDWEFVLAVHEEGATRHFDWEKVATPPVYRTGGAFRQRGKDGARRRGGAYPKNALTRPRDVVRATVGGGHLGNPLASQNEAPFPMRLVEYFVPVLCPPGGTVCDPFVGSGTTAEVAARRGLNFIGCDLRQSQVDLAIRRLAGIKEAA